MTAPHVSALVAKVDAAPMTAHLTEFARRTKLAGTPEERESFDYLRSCLDRYGFKTTLIAHDAYISLPGAARIQIGGSTPVCITHSFSRSTPPEGLRASLVYVGRGGAGDFAAVDARGKVVLVEGIANPAASLRASRAGAIGQVHISPQVHLHEMCISPVWGSPSAQQLSLLPSTVVLTIRQEDGQALKARLASGEEIETVLHAAVDTGWRKTPILQAELDPADPEAEDSFVMFSGHHDTWHLGVMDNGTANATMLEVARLFAPRRTALRRGLRLVFWSGHSQGRYSGSAWYADNHWDELSRRCVAHVNIDSTGAQGNTVLSDALSSAELFGLAAEAVLAQGGQELAGHRMSRAGDQSFWGIGIPSMFMGMGEQPIGAENPMSAIFGDGGERKGAGFGWWWHTADDTLDKIDPVLLVRDARIYVHALWRLLTSPVLPLDYSRQAEMLSRELAALAASVGDRIDLAPAQERVRVLRERVAALRSSTVEPKTLNRVLLAVSRELVPIDYTNGDRFDHDPALPQAAYPVLDPVRQLVSAPAGSDAARFAMVAARRAVNRLAFALDKANEKLGAAENGASRLV